MRKDATFAMALIVGLLFALPVLAAEQDRDTTSDLWLEAKLVTSYTLNQHLNPFKLKVDVKDGVAYISGTVDSPAERDLAVEIAKGIEGIGKVKEDIQVQPGMAGEPEEPEFYRKVEDATLTARIKSKLLWNRQTHGLDIEVSTAQGIVTLKGKVASDVHRDLAVQLARNTTGVKGVKNQLQVVPEKQVAKKDTLKKMETTVSDAWITSKVKSLLLFSKSAGGSDIEVVTDKGVVTLKGTVVTRTQEKAVVDMVGDVVGVKQVRSELTVGEAA